MTSIISPEILYEKELSAFKPKDYLRFVYGKDKFEGIDSSNDAELEDFISKIRSGESRFSNYTLTQLKSFAKKIQQLRE